MPPRPNWKGYLKLSLVSCQIALYPIATTSERVRFNTLNRKTGNRVKRQFVDAETGEVVENEDQVRGYEIARGQYIIVEDDELSAIALESTHTIEIESFAPRSSIDERYLDSPHYIAPDDRVAQEAFALIRETMRKNKNGWHCPGRPTEAARCLSVSRSCLLLQRGAGDFDNRLHDHFVAWVFAPFGIGDLLQSLRKRSISTATSSASVIGTSAA
jgi:hypothetical protein